MCSGAGTPMTNPVEKVATASNHSTPKRRNVLRKYAERSEDENSVTSSHDHPLISIPVLTSDQPDPGEVHEVVEVEPVEAVQPTRQSSRATLRDPSEHPSRLGTPQNPPESNSGRGSRLEQPEVAYVDPLQDVLASSQNGSQIWLSDAQQRRLSSAMDGPPLENGHSKGTSVVEIAIGNGGTNVNGGMGRRRSVVDEAIAALNEWKGLTPAKPQNVDQLFGLGELNKHLPNHRLRIFVGTWNVNGQVGIQEGIPEFKNWEVDLQKTIGLSHILLASEAVGTIHISVFIRRELIWFCTKPLISRYHLRLINSKNSKGFVGVFFCLFGSSIMVMTSHLTAGHSAESLDVRIAQLNRIYRELVIPRSLEQTRGLANRFDAVDYVFWFGDFNFRLQESRATVENTISEISSVQVEDNGEHLKKLLGWDQLHRHKVTSIVHDFNEHPISFLPTYKFDLNSDHYDRSSKQRTPSYTDRILFRSNGPGNPITCRCYQSANEVKSSDHRPVYGVFDLKIRPQVRALQDAELNAGLFNREVFTSAVGQLRREQALMKAAVGRRVGTSTVCSIL